ncbi:MAG: hypothetical protein LBT50_07265 [Prevotellaceae bacterium]|nr:hypothetical protein [Prevotellaceae bacterium]
MKFYFILLLIFFPFFVSAQTVVNGSVKNKEGKPIAANMMIQAKGNNIIGGFGTTDKDGNYNLTYKGTADSIVISANGINIGKHSKTAVNRSGRVDFVIDETPLELKEVKITQSKITRTGDTLNYSVGAYTDQNDRVIGDVLKKLPGVEVSKTGGIEYNGKAINKFYVENMDLLHGRYGLATNNISVKDVLTVQIMENHQPINALREQIFSEFAAINLKLKESAKGTLSVNGMAGLGYEPLLWNAELVAMYFAKVKQNMSAYKGNNSGNDVAGEFRTHYDYERAIWETSGQLSIQSPSTPPVAQKRYLYNNINSFTVNQLIKLKDDWECTVNALYYNDRQEKEGYSVYEQYFAGDSTLAIEEKVSSTSKINNAEIAVRLNANAKDYYLNNALNFKGNWNSDRGFGNTKSAGIDETILQHLNKPSFLIDNTLNVIKNVKKNSYNIYFSTGYAASPQTLTVTPALYNILGTGNLPSLAQNMLSKDFASILRLSYRLKLGNFNLDYRIWGRADVRNMTTDLAPDSSTQGIPDSLKNNIFYNNYTTGIHQSYTYKSGKFNSTVAIPVTYSLQTIDDRIPNRFAKYNRFIFSPVASASYNLTQEFTVSAKANYGNSSGDMNSSYTGYIMHGYRSLLRNTIERLYETRSGKAGISITYRNAFKALFLNGGVVYGLSWRNMLYGSTYQGITSVKTTYDEPTESDTRSITLNGSKGLSFWSATLRINSGYSEGRGKQFIQDEILDFRSKGYTAGTSINMTPFSFIGLNYSLSWNQSQNYTAGRPERFAPIRGTSQNIQLNIFPLKTLTINISAEHQYNSAITDGNRYTSFADAGVKFKRKKLDLELEFNNIFNSKQYVSASYNEISTYYYTYNLRPASVLLKARFKLK